MSSQLMKQFTQRINQSKVVEKSNLYQVKNTENNNRIISVKVNSNNIVKVVTNNKIKPYEIVDQIKDLVTINGLNMIQKRINLSQFTDCYYDLLFTKQEKNNDITESYFCTV